MKINRNITYYGTLLSRGNEDEFPLIRAQLNKRGVNYNELNKNGDYVLIKAGGDEGVVSYTCPNFVNPNLSFAYASSQYMMAKRMKKMTGLDEQMEIFVEQILGKFYHREQEADLSKIVTETYDKENLNNEWLPIMSVDVQRTGNIK